MDPELQSYYESIIKIDLSHAIRRINQQLRTEDDDFQREITTEYNLHEKIKQLEELNVSFPY